LLKVGIVAPSVGLRKLAAYRRQNQRDLAPQELGPLAGTLFMLDWLESPELRRRCVCLFMYTARRAGPL
jgi:TnpA family transposase